MTTLPRHDVRVPHVLGENTESELLVRYPRDPHGETEIVAVILHGTLVVDLDVALDADGQPDAELRIERAIRQHEHDDQTHWTPWAGVAL